MTSPNARKIVGGGVGAIAAVILGAVVAVEGGYVNNPSDPGGPTNHGVTQALARRYGYAGPMQDLSEAQARQILRSEFITSPGFAPMLQASPAVAQELVDSAVNTGPVQATKWLQRAVNALDDAQPIAVDGHFGHDTAGAYQLTVKRYGPVDACMLTIKLMDSQQAVFYMGLHEPEFIAGWIGKRIGNVPLSYCSRYPS